MKRVLQLQLCASLMVVASSLYAGDINVNKNLILVSPPDSEGRVTVTGMRGAVKCAVSGIVVIHIENDDTGKVVKGMVQDDGGFAVRLDASSKDKLKIQFIASSGDKERVKMKVPQAPSRHPPVDGTVPAVSRTKRPVYKIADPTPEIIIHYKEREAHKVIAVDPYNEIRQSGVLPPQ